MPIKQKLIYPVLARLAAPNLALFKSSARLTILAYHRVRDIPPDYLLDEDVISTTPENFEDEIKFCKKHFSVISFKILKEHFTHKIPLPPNPLIITFDDGYRDNYTHVFPILKKHAATATIFLAVDYIETGKLFWWDLTAAYVKSNPSASAYNIRQILRTLKDVSNEERVSKIKEFTITLGDKLSAVERQVMTWKEIKKMSEGGIEFGSHTMTHPVLSRLTDDRQLTWELTESKKIIEQRLNKEVTALSYPVGGQTAFTDAIQSKIKDAGYSFAVSYMHGVNPLRSGLNYFDLKRLDADKLTLDKFKIKLAFPWLFK